MNLIELGKVVKPHGYSGAFLVTAVSGATSALSSVQEVLIGLDRSSTASHEIIEAAWMPKGWKVQVKGIATEAQAKSLIGKFLFAERSALPELEAGEFYVEDLVGAEVQTATEKIGVLRAVQSGVAGSSDIWWIETSKGEIAVPAVKRYVESITLHPTIIRLKNLSELEPLE